MSIEKVATRSLGDKITLVVLIGIMLIGVGVLAGWHLHLRAVVQVIPGTVPMQYNTALCFLVLGASGWAIVARRGHRLLPAAGGGFIASIAVLVVFEHMTEVSLGIDTVFFQQWDRPLNASSGRIALMPALSFLSSGAALILLTFRPRALPAFAIAHTVPLSLGFTSLFLYLVWVTFGLPFRVGIQMAVTTALGFVAYGSVMLGYALRRAPRNEEGFRSWVPAVATILVLAFFVGFTVTTQRNSPFARAVQLLLGLVVAVLLGALVDRLREFKIAYKGLALISVPLVFVLAFILLVKEVKRNNEEAQVWSLHSKEVIVQAETLLRTLGDAETSVRGFIITSNSDFAERYQRATQEVPEATAELQALVRDNSEQSDRAYRLGLKASARMEQLGNIERLVRAGDSKQAVEQVKSGAGKHIMDDFRNEMAAFLEQEERMSVARRQTVEESWQRFNWLLVAGASVDVLLGLMLAFLFSRGISKRLLVLTDNSQALAAGKELAQPMTGSDEIAHLDRVFHDMARALDEAARKERALIENALDVICSVDAEGKFVKVNPACFTVWGYTPDELIGRRYIELVAPEDVTKTNQAALEIMAGKSVSDFENRYARKDGSRVWVMWSAFWSENEKLMFAVARDVTERKRSEEKVKQLNENLERYATQLEAANKELESFSYSVSHDLRAPLRHIHGFADLLQKHVSSAQDEKSQRYAKTISDSAKQMGCLVDDLLAFSRMGRAEMRTTLVDFEQFVREVMRDLQKDTDGRIVAWKVDKLPAVRGDPSMLRLVLMNLMSNAVKYTRTRAEAHIEIGSTNGHQDETVFFVRDNGVGFDMRYVDKLFGVFQRLHRSDEFEGTGIGLANVRRIIHRHGGKTWAEGSIDGGATFYFSLPKI